jgi:hypothetical protein
MSDLDNSIVKILNRKKRLVGTGFVLEGRFIVSCAHVIENAGYKIGDTVKVRFLNIENLFNATILEDFWRNREKEDIAFLKLDNELPFDIMALPLGSFHKDDQNPFETFGFADLNPMGGILAKGEILGSIHLEGVEVLQLRSQEVTSGFSGAPVWDPIHKQIVGMITSIATPDEFSRQSATAFAIRSELLVEICPEIPFKHHSESDNLFGVPQLPLHYLPRADDLDPIKDALLSDNKGRVGITGRTIKIGVHGMGGIGKSVLAAALAREEIVQQHFPDGIVWLTIGQSPSLINRQLQLASAFGYKNQDFRDPQHGKSELEQILKRKACLLILDDVWNTKHIEAFDCLGPKSRLLLTTRDASIVRDIGGENVQIGVLKEDQALTLLANWSRHSVNDLPPEVKDVAKECGYLPLALAMIGGMVKRNPESWKRALHRLKHADLHKLKRQFIDYPYDNLLSALRVSVDSLPPHIRNRYFDLAVFPEDVLIPKLAVKILWNSQIEDSFEATELLEELVDRSLVIEYNQSYRLHDLLRDYIHKQIGDLTIIHKQLVNSYEKFYQMDWARLDEYGVEYLPYHYHHAKKYQGLKSLLLSPYILQKNKNVGISGLRDDFNIAQSDLLNAEDLDGFFNLFLLEYSLFSKKASGFEPFELLIFALSSNEWDRAKDQALAIIDPDIRFMALCCLASGHAMVNDNSDDFLQTVDENAVEVSSYAVARSSLFLAIADYKRSFTWLVRIYQKTKFTSLNIQDDVDNRFTNILL